MRPPPKKRKVTNGKSLSDAHANANASLSNTWPTAATEEEKLSWQGFCEIESEPAFFNIMLKEFGVQGVKVQEVLGLDEELIAILPQPVYGLIFLFRFRSEESFPQEAACPEHVWFANQTSDFACATVAMLNIVNNVPGLHLGDHLQRFKDFTMGFTPAMRGDQIGNFEFVKHVHNSFARKMDMLNIDLGMKNAYADGRTKILSTSTATNHSKKSKSPKSGKSKAKKASTDEDYEDDSAFHFIAYLPIGGEVWKLDGLDRQPARLGPIPQDGWLRIVTPILATRMAEYEEGQIEFGLLSLVKDPIIHHREQLAENIRALQTTEDQLNNVQPDWRAFTGHDDIKAESTSRDEALSGPSPSYGISGAMLNEASIPDPHLAKASSDCPFRLLELRHDLLSTQTALRAAVREEEASNRADEQRAIDRRHDYGPLIHRWLGMLAEKDIIRVLVDQTR